MYSRLFSYYVKHVFLPLLFCAKLLTSNEKVILNFACFLLGDSPASEFYIPTFRNTLFHLHRQVGRHVTAYEDGTECSETSAYKFQTPGNHPKESIQHSGHGESMKSRIILNYLRISCFPFSWFKIRLFNNTLKKFQAMNNQTCRIFWREPIWPLVKELVILTSHI